MRFENTFGEAAKLILALVIAGGMVWCASGAGKKPIVDVSFDAPYGQIAASQGDEWAPTWADDGNLYTGNDDGSNFGGIQGRSVAFGKIIGNDLNHLTGVTISDMGAFGDEPPRPDKGNWKTMNSYCVDGVLYMFVTRCLYPEQSGDEHHRHVFKNSSIIKSTDKGKTWARSSEENYQHPMFPGLAFGAPYFVWYGQNGAAKVNNADKYVYAVANNGHFEDGDYYILGRVQKGRLANLDERDWQFYTGGNGMSAGNWNTNSGKAKPILQDTMNCSMTGMTYIADLGRYVMVVWHYTKYNLRADPQTINDYYEAPKPWGPWTKFKTVDTGDLGWYVPIVAQKFQARGDKNSVRCVLFPTGNYTKSTMYKVNYIPITFSTVPLSGGGK